MPLASTKVSDYDITLFMNNNNIDFKRTNVQTHKNLFHFLKFNTLFNSIITFCRFKLSI